jgi:hypothetical protein
MRTDFWLVNIQNTPTWRAVEMGKHQDDQDGYVVEKVM